MRAEISRRTAAVTVTNLMVAAVSLQRPGAVLAGLLSAYWTRRGAPGRILGTPTS